MFNEITDENIFLQRHYLTNISHMLLWISINASVDNRIPLHHVLHVYEYTDNLV